MDFIPYGKQWVTEEDISIVSECLRSPYLTVGPKIAEFEEKFAQLVGAKHAIAVCNATAALHLAMIVGGVQKGHRVITSPITFLASANCAAYVDAIPDFCDIDPISLTLCPNSLAEGYKDDLKAVVAVDYAGQSAEMPRIAEFARKKGVLIIEDACHAVGGKFEHQKKIFKIGGHEWADMTVFSFHPVKTMTTGEGGMLVTSNDRYAQRARLLRSHGIVRDWETFEAASNCEVTLEKGPWFYEMQELGFNYRLTEIQAALGISQLNKLGSFIKRRSEIVAAYDAALCDIPWISTPKCRNPADLNLISWHLYTLRIDFPRVGKSRTEVMEELKSKGVGSQVLYIPVHLQPWYRRTYGYQVGKCPMAEKAYATLLSVPLFPAMTNNDVARVIESIRQLKM